MQNQDCCKMAITVRTFVAMKTLCAVCLLFSLALFGCEQGSQEVPPQALGNQEAVVFDDLNIGFQPGIEAQSGEALADLQYLDAGRTVYRSIVLPRYEKAVKITLRVRLVSNGDPWDKYGSVFLIPKGSQPHIAAIDSREDSLPSGQESALPYGLNEEGFEPMVELMRFATPFGVGHWSDTLHYLRPIYVPKWENEVVWEQDVSHLAEALSDTVELGVFVDTWTDKGYRLTASLHYEESEGPMHRRTKTYSHSLVNTVKYLSRQHLFDGVAYAPITTRFELPDSAKNVRLLYVSTGHGGHGIGDEFVEKENIIKVDGTTVHAYTPWRDDCASFRRFNPTSGVWTEKVLWRGDSIDERIASSDYSRSGWCPGSDVDPVVIPLGDLKGGSHRLEISIPHAQPLDAEKNEMNHWLISALLVWE